MFDVIDKIMNSETKPVEYVDLSDNPLLNPNFFNEKLGNINSMTDSEILDLVKHTYSFILDEVYNKNYSLGMSLFTNIKFLTAFSQVISNVSISDSQRKTINKLCYDYLTWTHEKDENVKRLLFVMSKTVNRDVLPGLLGLGLSEDLADFLALSRFSSSKEMINVKRVNLIIRSQPSSLMTEQMIVNIYSKLFSEVTPLFTGTVLDVEEDLEPWSDQSLVYSTISNAVLDILETLPLDGIRQVLLSYKITRDSYYAGKDVRFSINNLGDDYNRINTVVNRLRDAENVVLP